MRITAEVLPGRLPREFELGPSATGLDLLHALGLAPDAHLLVRQELPIPADEPLEEGDWIRVVAVISGGMKP